MTEWLMLINYYHFTNDIYQISQLQPTTILMAFAGQFQTPISGISSGEMTSKASNGPSGPRFNILRLIVRYRRREISSLK